MTELDNINRLQLALHGHGMNDCPHGDIIDNMIERQERLAISHESFSSRIDGHMHAEEEFKKVMGERFKAGDERMACIEREITALNKLVDAFDGFQKTLKLTAYFAAATVSIILWIFAEKNNDIKATQDTILKHSIALEKLVSSHQELEKDFRREIDQVRSNHK